MTLHQTFSQLETLIPDLSAAILMGHDGIPVIQNIFNENLDVSELILECSELLQSAKRMLEAYGLEELSVKTQKGHITLVPVDQDYFIFIYLAPAGLPGKARYTIRRMLPIIKSQL